LRENFQARRRYIIPTLDPIGHDPGRFNGGALASLKRLETVIGNLREVAERLVPGRACISVVPDHGIVKTGAPFHLFPAFRKARLPSSGWFEVAAARSPGVLDSSSKRCSMAASEIRKFILLSTIMLLASTPSSGQQAGLPSTTEGDFVVKNFKFRSGETLPELRLHYTTLGKPVRNAEGRVTNAVLILHGTGGSGQQFLQQQFAGELFGPGQLLDANRYYIILPDGVGHGKSSKPSDGLHARFPQYDYDDMVAAHYQLLSEGLGINHLRLILGTSMGCMHSFVWGETYPFSWTR